MQNHGLHESIDPAHIPLKIDSDISTLKLNRIPAEILSHALANVQRRLSYGYTIKSKGRLDKKMFNSCVGKIDAMLCCRVH